MLLVNFTHILDICKKKCCGYYYYLINVQVDVVKNVHEEKYSDNLHMTQYFNKMYLTMAL